MSADKLIILYGLLAKPEASYNDGGTLAAATDGVLLAEPAEMTIGYVHDGARGRANGSAGTLKRGKQSGRFAETSFKVEGRGPGSAYSASNLPEVNTLMRLSGHSATVDTTAGEEKVTYAPISSNAGSGFTSGVLECYARGQKYAMTGVYGDFNFSIDGPGFFMFEFPVSGLIAIPTDVTLPAITYGTQTPPKAESITFSIGAWSPIVRKIDFKAARARAPRADVNSAGHKGFSMGGRAPVLEVTVEAAALSTFDPYTARENGTTYALALTQGGSQYNRVKFAAAQAQIVDVAEDDDDPTGLWTLSLALSPSTPTSNDDYTITFD